MKDGKKIIELVYLSTELDILDLRLHELDDIVDKLVIVEYPFDYARKPRTMYYNENKERFKKFEHKIIHIIDDNEYSDKEFADGGSSGIGLMWNRKNSKLLLEPLSSFADDDFFISFDGDALMKRSAFDNFDITKPTTLIMKWCMYWFNYYTLNSTYNWSLAATCGTVREVGSIGGLVGWCPPGEGTIQSRVQYIDNAGWHFAKCGGVDKIIENIKGYPHQEFNVPEFTDRNKVQERIDNGWGWNDTSKGTHEGNWTFVYEDYKPENYPKYLNDNPEIYNNYFKGGMK